MAEFPALPLFTDAYLADTRHLTTEQHGAYLLLMIEAWRRPECALPDDDALLARLAGVSVDVWAGMKSVILAFWTRDGRRKVWTQNRLVKERLYVAQKSRSQRDKVLKRWNKKKNAHTAVIPDAYPADTPTPTPIIEEPNGSSLSVPEPTKPAKPKRKTEYPEKFETFWRDYPRDPNMSKAEAYDAWKKLPTEEQDAAIAALPAFKAYCRSKPDYRPIHACRFLTKRRAAGFLEDAPKASADDRPTGYPAHIPPPARARDLWQRGLWQNVTWGPPPGEPGCAIPEPIQREWIASREIQSRSTFNTGREEEAA